jgi:hypothetical protein
MTAVKGSVEDHSIDMPNYLGSGCLVKNASGKIEYRFGPQAYFN